MSDRTGSKHWRRSRCEGSPQTKTREKWPPGVESPRYRPHFSGLLHGVDMSDEQDYIKREPRFDGPGAQAPETPDAAPTGAQPGADQPGAFQGEASGLEQQLQEAERKAQEHHEAWLRARADMENLRKRSQIDVANAHKYAVENLASELLPVRDALEAALAT